MLKIDRKKSVGITIICLSPLIVYYVGGGVVACCQAVMLLLMLGLSKFLSPDDTFLEELLFNPVYKGVAGNIFHKRK